MYKLKYNYLAVYLLVTIFSCICQANRNNNGINVGVVEILSVSTRKEVENFDPMGSIVGGTMVYLKVKNHSMTPSENKVFIGPYPCIIAEKGISGNLISCMTTAQTEPDRFWQLPVVLHVFQKLKSSCKSSKGKCVFTYTRGATPYLKYISPNAGTPDQKVVVNAIWRVTNTNQIKKIKIGDDNCNRFELEDLSDKSNPTNLNDDVSIKKSHYQNVQCQLSKEQVAGLYKTSFETSYGDLYKLSTATYVTADGSRQYEFAIIPEISSLNTNSGGEYGNQLVITGKGFGDKTDNVQVKVEDLNCNIKFVSNNKIVCDLEEGITSTPQPDKFIKGQGARYTKYRLGEFKDNQGNQLEESLYDTPKKLREGIFNNTIEQERKMEDYTIGSWESVYGDDIQQEDQVEGKIGVHVRGYFKAPRTGKYGFWIANDDTAQVFLNKQPRNTTIDADQDLILDKCAYTHARDYLQPYQCGAYRYETDIDLQEGEFYWIELFTIDNKDLGHFTLSVETPEPQDGSLWSNAMDGIQQLTIVPQKDNEQWSLKMFGSDEQLFEFSFKYTDSKTRKVTFNPKTGGKKWQDWDPQFLVTKINNALYKLYDAVLVDSFDLNVNGERCTNIGCVPKGKEVILEFQKLRPKEGKYSSEIQCNLGPQNCKVQKTQEPSSGLSGTFQMEVEWESKGQLRKEFVEVWLSANGQRAGGWYRDIPVSMSIHSIKQGLVRLDSIFEDVIVYQKGAYVDGKTYIFDWRSDVNKERSPKVTLNLANVNGGIGRPQVDSQNIVEQSKRPFYEPIPFDMSYVNADSPGVQVIVNDIVAQCNGDCRYETYANKTPVLNSFSLENKNVTLNLSLNNFNNVMQDISVQYGGYECIIGLNSQNINLQSLKCEVEGIEAGDNRPNVLFKNVGYTAFKNANQFETEDIKISQISPSTGSVNGGQIITISGSGFPKQDLNKATVKFGTINSIVKSTKYNQMQVVLPASLGKANGQQSVTVAYNGMTSNNDIEITYSDQDTPTISNVKLENISYSYNEHIKASPVKKQLVKIYGTNFGYNKDDIQVWLLQFNNDKSVWEQKYQINVNTINNGTEITATISGGRAGEYELRVYHTLHGYSIQGIQFSYRIEIQSISIDQGAKQGGQKMIIAGINFSPVVGNNQVFFEQDGGTISKLAEIEQQSSTQLVIRVPSMDTAGDINKPWQITYFGRIIEQAVCMDNVYNCQYTYLDNIDTPVVTVQGVKNVKNGDSIQIEGINFPISQDTAQAIIQGYDSPIDLNLNSTTKLGALQVPNDIETGTYRVQIRLESYGVIGSFYIQVDYEILQVQPQRQVSTAGEEITVKGSGFTKDTLIAVNGQQCVIRSQSTTQIQCTAQPIILEQDKINKVVDVIAYNQIQSTTCKNCLQYAKAVTPQILNSTPLSKNSVKIVPNLPFTYRIESQNGFGQNNVTGYLQSIYSDNFRIQSTVVQDGDAYDITFSNIIAGEYQVLIHVEGKGFAQIKQDCNGNQCTGPTSKLTFTLEDSIYQSGDQTGLTGGTDLTIQGQGFNYIQESLNRVSVCGHQCNIVPGSVTLQELKCKLPQVNTKYLFDGDYNSQVEQVNHDNRKQKNILLLERVEKYDRYFKAIYTSETQNQNVLKSITQGPVQKQNDNKQDFWIQFHAQQGTKIFVDTMILHPAIGEFNLEPYFENVKLQARNQESENWIDLDVFDAGHLSEQSEVNFRVRETGDDSESNRKSFIHQNSYKQFRVIETQQDISAFASLYVKKVIGHVFYEQNIDTDQDFMCDTVVQVNGQYGGIQNNTTIRYNGQQTPIITDISPSFSTYQGSEIIIKGEKFGNNSDRIKVYVKGQLCNITKVQDDQIQVQVPAYAPLQEEENIIVTLDNVPALIKKGINFFPGALLWSHEATWGGETAPTVNNTVVVPKGQTLVVDQSTPKPLETVIVEGTLLFDPDLNLDIEFDVVYMIIRKGQLIAGTEFKPYKNKLIFTLHGSFSQTKQLPEYGNKVIGCHNCLLDLHGDIRGPPYAFLDQTVDKNSDQLIVDRDVDWRVGDSIGISTTDYNGEHSEKLTIKNIVKIGQNKTKIDFSPKLKHKHLGEEEIFGSKKLEVRAEVIYLSSNLIIQGNPKDSIQTKYGGHLMVHGRSEQGTLARIEGVEFRYTGQPRIIGRYTCHLHMLGDSPNSYVRNIKVHDAFARVVAIHATSYLRVQNNVGFKVPGHNIFLEDGVETNNLVEGNVIISPRSSFTMLQTDITVAGIWITNPSNFVRYNIVAGSEFYGLWYEIKEKPDSRIDLCPHGMPVLQLEHNIGHSCQRFGLRFFHLKPRKYPCQDTKDGELEDPFSKNPSYQYIYRNQTSYKNGESGILAEFMGDSIFQDCILADNFRTGFQAHVTNFTQAPVVLRDSVIVGNSTINGETVPYISSAILTPRTGGFLVDNVEIYNMPVNTNIIESSSDNFNMLLWVQGGYQQQFQNIKIHNSQNAGIVRWRGPRANMIYDQDGSVTGTQQPTWIAPYNPHFDRLIGTGECQNKTQGYDNSVVCTVPIRAVRFSNFIQYENFYGQLMRIFDLRDQSKTYQINASYDNKNTYGDMLSYIVKNHAQDLKGGYIALLPVNSVYNIHWNKGIEWDHLLVWPSYETQSNDQTIVLRFPYSEQRELFEVFRMVAEKNVKLYHKQSDINRFFNPSTYEPNNGPNGCVNGDWIQEENYFYLCLNGKGRDNIKYQQIDINGVYCRDTCDTGGFTCQKESKVRNFMEPNHLHSQTYLDKNLGAIAMAKSPGTDEWEFRVPQEGDDVKIPCEWTMRFNLDSFKFNNLYIDGTLRIEESSAAKKTIIATNIWVRGGKLVAGSQKQRFSQNLEIILTGDQQSESLVIDDISRTGTKSLAVTGQLELFGIIPKTVRTRLAQTANKGDNQLKLKDDISDWNIGDELVLGANNHNGNGFEKVKIIGKDELNKIVTLEHPIQYWHYGNQVSTVSSNSQDSEVTIDEKYGDGILDLRTSVGHITRNIKIKGNKEQSNWGGHLQIYQYVLQDEKTGQDINARGNAVLEGVELDNMGQRGIESAGVHVMMTKQEGADQYLPTILKGCSIHDCVGMCVNIQDAQQFSIENSVIYNGRKFLIQALNSQQIQITNNLLIGLEERKAGDTRKTKIWDPTALIHMYTPYLPSRDNIQVTGNVGSGSEGIGYAFPGTPCQEKHLTSFKNNEVSFAAYTGVLFNLDQNKCYHVGYVQVHNCVDGVTLNSANTDDGYDGENFLIAECKINLKLHSGSTALVHNNYLRNSWISAVARPNCLDCYTKERLDSLNSKCTNVSGIQLHVTTRLGESFPWEKDPFQYDVICTAPSAFGSSFITEVELHMFKQEYNKLDHPNLIECQENRGFRNHRSAASATAGTYLRNVKCTECEKDGLIHIMDPKEAWLGWFGGCGQFDCTGLENVLVQDLTGDFLGHQGSIVSNNENITISDGMKDLCTYYSQWNAYDCLTTDFAVLEWDAVSEDKQKLKPAPVYVQNQVFSNKLNMWREWSWQGPEPLNERFNRFVSLVLINQKHTINYSGSQCTNIVHKLQQRSTNGEINRYIIVKYQYTTPLALEISVQGKIISPQPLTNPLDLATYNSTNCGANNYFFDNNTIEWVITNEADCHVNVYQKNYLLVNLRLKITPKKFYENDNSISSFINIITAFLQVDYSQVRIVGVKSYARRRILEEEEEEEDTQLSFIVLDAIPTSQDNGYKPKEDYVRLKNVANNIQQGFQNENISLGYEVEFESASPKVVKKLGLEISDNTGFIDEQDLIDTPNGPDSPKPNDDTVTDLNNKQIKEEKNSMIAIALGMVFGTMAAVIVALIVYHFWKRRQLKGIQNISDKESSVANEKQIVSNTIFIREKSRQSSQYDINHSQINEGVLSQEGMKIYNDNQYEENKSL